MSCRRADSTKFIGCRGSAHHKLCNCQCWECTACQKKHAQFHTREDLLTLPWTPTHTSLAKPHLNGRTGLYSPTCHSHHRPKFICANRTCRRGIKPFYAPEINEYDISPCQSWKVRPLVSRKPMLALTMFNWRHGIGPAPEEVKLLTRGDDMTIIGKYRKGGLEALTGFERVALGWTWHENWFVEVGLEKRCPGCGGSAMMVGSNFRVPKRRYERAWREIEGWIEEGRDLVAMFVNCATVEQHREWVEKAIEIRKERGVVDALRPS